MRRHAGEGRQQAYHIRPLTRFSTEKSDSTNAVSRSHNRKACVIAVVRVGQLWRMSGAIADADVVSESPNGDLRFQRDAEATLARGGRRSRARRGASPWHTAGRFRTRGCHGHHPPARIGNQSGDQEFTGMAAERHDARAKHACRRGLDLFDPGGTNKTETTPEGQEIAVQ